VFTAPTYISHTLPQVVPNPGNLGSNFLTVVGSSTLPVVRPSSPYILSHEGCELIPLFTKSLPPVHGVAWSQIPNPSFLSTASSDPIIVSELGIIGIVQLMRSQGVTSPRIPIPTPIVSSSGPQRTGKHAKGLRKYNPVKLSNRRNYDEDEHEDGWDVALAQFQAKLHDIVHSGQPTVGLSPEMALAAKTRIAMEEELKRSVSCIFYCVPVRRFTDVFVLAAATPEHQGWRGETPQGHGGLSHRPTKGDIPIKASSRPESGWIGRDQHKDGRLCKA